ncbi:hypothetical protein SPRG_10339 [Saprolegnia parasitica CBS 223.65]|uniref:Uncharacterized protein n=1 Tax=Saprolegnia parasitica (strain CBS 223.65) TaxID=695850 RepID=A0A067C159_SAPPC|nr:hypothetical protein SPRG_10339 [Saprolegnia parasitica CBS 223.65]KDO24524.1 hypothetical protein SPRG_10339 [Saprolegnia parasitica CBS 223.65]|eukprot:XP_012204786.1 hypothetical protein SPRG_10339 [Saprolegnia parasitica CBS 223.65]
MAAVCTYFSSTVLAERACVLADDDDCDFELGPPPPMHMGPTLMRQCAVDLTLPQTTLPSISNTSMRKLCFATARSSSLEQQRVL